MSFQPKRRLIISKKKLLVICAAILAFSELLITHLTFIALEHKIHDVNLESFESEAYKAARYSDINTIKSIFKIPCDIYIFDSDYDLIDVIKELNSPFDGKDVLINYLDENSNENVFTVQLNRRLRPSFASIFKVFQTSNYCVVITSTKHFNKQLYTNLLSTSILVVIIAVTLLLFLYLYYHYKQAEDFYHSEYNKKTYANKKTSYLHKSIALLRNDIDAPIIINSLLVNLCSFYNADSTCVYLFSHNRATIKLEYEYCSENIPSTIKGAKDIPVSSFHVDTNYMTPIQQDNSIVGYLVLNNPKYSKSDLSFLKTMSYLIYTELLRIQQNDVEHKTLRILASNFMAVSYIDFYADTIFTYNLEEIALSHFENSTYYSENIGHYIETMVAPEDRERCHLLMTPGNIMKELENKDSYSINFIDIYSGVPRNFQTTFTKANSTGTQVILFTVDNTNLLKSENENQAKLKEALLKAEEASKAKSSFLFNMSHDIRTPMNAILGFTRMAQKNVDNKEKVLENLSKLNQSGEHMLSLINDILDMSRAESGKIVLSEMKANVFDFDKGISPMLQELADKKNIELSFVINEIRNPYVYIDKMHLNSCLINLISNAIKYSNFGCYVTASITQLESDKNRPNYGIYKFTVEDNGIGISKEYLSQIFEPFSRERSSTTSGQQGTGLGLSITKKYVEAMGGTISVESEPGVGSKFTFIVPLRIQDENIGNEVITKQKTQNYNLENLHILLADDNDLNREIAIDLLIEKKMIVDEAVNGQEVLNLLETNGIDSYDLILMDIQMPIMDGYEATKQIRANYPNSKIPIIALSANAFEEDRTLSLNTGMNEHLSKPIDPEKLYNTIMMCTKAKK